jgi:hypothetical protein
MNNRQVISVLVAMVLVAVGVFVTYKNRTAQTEKEVGKEIGSSLIPGFPLNDIESIDIKTAKDEVGLVRPPDGQWGVRQRDGYPANYDYVKDLVVKVKDAKIVEVTPVGKSQLGRLQLIDPSTVKPDDKEKPDEKDIGTLVIFKKAGDQEVGRIVLGKTIEGASRDDGPFGFNLGGSTGRFIQVGGNSDVAYKIKESFSSVNADPKGWVDKAFIQPSGGLKSLSVQVTEPADQSWKIEREKEGADPVMADKKEGENIDPEKLKQAGSAFSSAYFDDLATAADKEKSGVEKPSRVATVSYFDGFTYVINVGNKVKAEDENSDYYLGLKVDYQQVPAPVEPTEAAPIEPQPTPPPAGETDEQKKEREKKDQEAKTTYDEAKKRFDDVRKKFDDDKKKWEEDKKKKEERLGKEKTFEGRIYIVTKYTVDWFLKDRKYFIKDPAAAPAATSTEPPPPLVTTPSPATTPATTPPGTPPAAGARSKRIEAVTPPVTVEIPPKKEGDPKKPATSPPKPAPKSTTPAPPPKPSAPPNPDSAKPGPSKPPAGSSTPEPKPADAPAPTAPPKPPAESNGSPPPGEPAPKSPSEKSE